MEYGELILIAGLFLAGGLLASRAAAGLGVPALSLFLVGGVFLGEVFPINVDYELARGLGVLALALILFEGGLTSSYQELKPVMGSALRLATLGTFLTALFIGIGASLLLDIPFTHGLLLGAVLAPTDGAAIFSLLRNSTLKRKLAYNLEAEAGLNDAVAVILVLAMIDLISQEAQGVGELIVFFIQEAGIGALVGIGIGALAAYLYRRLSLTATGLYPVASLAAAAVSFGLADSLHGSGFLAVYLTGLVIGSSVIPTRSGVISFHEGMAWVAQIGLFLLLGFLSDFEKLIEVAASGILIALLMMLVARPLAVLGALPWGFSFRERAVLGWAGLRGAVPAVLALFPVIAGVEEAGFFNLVFFAVLFSTLLQGASFEPVAKLLGQTTKKPAIPLAIADSELLQRLGSEIAQYTIKASDSIVAAKVRDLGLPRKALLMVILRDEQAIPPRGSTELKAEDELYILVRQEAARSVRNLMDIWEVGPLDRAPLLGMRPRSSGILSIRPWSEGDCSKPRSIDGTLVFDYLAMRSDRPGSLVMLQDGRYALCGESLMVGSKRPLEKQLERKLQSADEASEAQWLAEALTKLLSHRVGKYQDSELEELDLLRDSMALIEDKELGNRDSNPN